MARARYTRQTELALAAFSNGRCYYPDCSVPIIMLVEGEPVPNAQRAHIRGRHEGGPRHDRQMTNAERDHYSNLLFLCQAHHNYVDKKHPDRFPPAVLLTWKAARESGSQTGLAALGQVNEERLREIVVEAVEIRNERIEAALRTIEDGFPEVVTSVRTLIESADLLTSTGMFPSLETAELLHDASEGLRNLPDLIDQLYGAAEALRAARPEY